MNPLIKDLRAFYADQIARGRTDTEAWRAVCNALPVCITTCHLARLITQPLEPHRATTQAPSGHPCNDTRNGVGRDSAGETRFSHGSEVLGYHHPDIFCEQPTKET